MVDSTSHFMDQASHCNELIQEASYSHTTSMISKPFPPSQNTKAGKPRSKRRRANEKVRNNRRMKQKAQELKATSCVHSKVGTSLPGRPNQQSSDARLVGAGLAIDQRHAEELAPERSSPRKKQRPNREFRGTFTVNPCLVAKQTANLH